MHVINNDTDNWVEGNFFTSIGVHIVKKLPASLPTFLNEQGPS